METILCAVDFSSFSSRVVRTGAGLARAFGARLILFHTVNFPVDALYGSDLPERNVKAKRLAAAAREKMAGLMSGLDAAWEPFLAEGDPVEALETVIQSRGVDLVVTASRGIGGVERIFVGTVVERMVLRVPRPILILRPPPRGASAGGETMLKRILVGCDLRTPHDPAQELARRLARCLDAELHLVHVIQAPSEEPRDDSYQHTQQVLQTHVHQRMQQTCLDADPSERIYIDVCPGVPADTLRSCARRMGCDLIVVGVHRVGALRGALIGTTARQLLRKAPCSLLTIPEKHCDLEGPP
jgi:nucleotide-binding universal stress UspA family protein